MRNSIGRTSTPRKSLTRTSRMRAGMPPAWPLTIAPSASRCASPAFSSITPPSTQLPSAITLPERITSAKARPSSTISPQCPRSMR